MNVQIQGVNWNVPLHNKEPFLGYPKWKVVNCRFENDHQVFYRITDSDEKYCWTCKRFVKAENFFWLCGDAFYAERIPNGKNAPYCMGCLPERRTLFR